jgi:hypothetical protein
VKSKFTSRSAKAFLLEHVFAQAKLDDISFSDLELKLLKDDEERPDDTIDEGALADFELSKRDAFFENVAVLLKRSRERFEKQNAGSRDFADSIPLASDNDDYFGIILWDRFQNEILSPQAPATWKDNLLALALILIGLAALVGGIFYWADHSPEWRARYQQFLAQHPRVASLGMPYVGWLQNPQGWFQQNAGKYVIMGVLAFAVVYWGRVVLRFLNRGTTDSIS